MVLILGLPSTAQKNGEETCALPHPGANQCERGLEDQADQSTVCFDAPASTAASSVSLARWLYRIVLL